MLKKLFDSNFVYYIPIWIVLSILGSAGGFYLIELTYATLFRSAVLLKVIVAVVVTALLFITVLDWNTIKEKKKLAKRIAYSFIFCFFLALSYVWGYQMEMNGMTDVGVKGKLFSFLVSGGVGIGMMPLANLWFLLMDKVKLNRDKEQKALPKKTTVKLFFLSFGIILLCWIPVFLAYYPAIMSYDFHRQSQDAWRGWIWFTTHHPLIHTALIRWFLLLGDAIGSFQVAMALFSIMQMLVLSSVYAYSCTMITRLTGKKWPMWVATAWFALLPFHPVMALSMTKDTLFTGFMVLFVVLMLEYRMATTQKKRILLYIALIIIGVLALMFRNNAAYAFLAFALFYILFTKKQRLQILLLCVAVLLGSHIVKETMQKSMEARDGNSIEMYSIPLQQMCRTGANHFGYLTEDDHFSLNYYVPEEYWLGYMPHIADSLKSSVALSTHITWQNDVPSFIKTWVRLGVKYPNDYLDAFLAMTQGYWFIDDMSHAEVLGFGEDTNLGFLYTFNASKSDVFEGVESHSYLPGLLKIYQKIVNGNSYQYWPVLRLLFKPAFYTWIFLLCIMSVSYLKEKNKVILYLFPFMYLMTLLLGPVVNFRYVYPVISTIPFFIAWVFSKKDWWSAYVALPKKEKIKKVKNDAEENSQS